MRRRPGVWQQGCPGRFSFVGCGAAPPTFSRPRLGKLRKPSTPQQTCGMNPMHREAADSVRLHLFRELSTLGQQLTHALLLGHGLGGIKPMFPARPSRPRQAFGGARSGTGTAVHTAFAIAGHRHALPRPALAAPLGVELR